MQLISVRFYGMGDILKSGVELNMFTFNKISF